MKEIKLFNESPNNISYDDLIRMEIDGKNKAQKGYDSIIWRIRSGYAVILYGSLSLIATSVDKEIITITPQKSALCMSLIVIGFSFFAVILDNYFLQCKIQVVNATNKLMDIALEISFNRSSAESLRGELEKLLHNSGEPKGNINWILWNSRLPLLLYLCTSLVAVLIVQLIVFFP